MSRLLYGNLDLVLNQLLNARLQMLGADPSPLEAQVYYNSTAKEIRYHNGTAWVALGLTGAGGPPSGAAGGDLTGSYPTPQIAAGVIVDADVNSAAAIAQAKIANLSTDLSNRLLKYGDAMTGGDLTLFRNPTSNLHAATKQYVDITSQGFSFKQAVKAVSTTNRGLSGLTAVDGVTLAGGERVLLAAQTDSTQNGIWMAQPATWIRAADMNDAGHLVDGTLVPVAQGTVNADSQWLCTAIQGGGGWTPPTTGSTWTKMSSLTDLVAGAGMTKTGNTLDVVSATADLTVQADSITVVAAPKWTTGRTVTLTGDVTGVSGAFDGSAALSFTTAIGAGVIVDADVSGSAAIATSKIAGLDAALLAAGKRYSVTLSTASPQTVTHNLNTRDVHVAVYNTAGSYEEIDVEVEHTTVNTVTIKHNPALPAGYRCVVLA